MRYEVTETVANRISRPIVGATVQIKDLAGNNLTLYTTESGGGTEANPTTTGTLGRIDGGAGTGIWVEAPDYDLVVTYGAQTYTHKVRRSPSGEFPVDSYGAKGDGSDDSVEIQAAIDAANAAGGGDVTGRGRAKTYKIGGVLDLKANVCLRDITIDQAGMALVNGRRIAVKAEGSVGAKLTLSANAVQHEYTVTASSVAGLAVGDYVQLGSDTFYGYAGQNTNKGEIKRIRSIVGSVISFEEALCDGYTTAANAFVRKVTFVENVAVERVRIVGDAAADSAEYGVYLKYVNGFRVKDCNLENQDIYSIATLSSIRGEISGNRIRQTFYDGVTGLIFYAIVCLDSSQWIRVVNNHAERTRHLGTVTSNATGNDFYGQPRWILFQGNVMKDAMANGAGHSWGFSHHGFGEFITFDSNFVDSAFGGIRIGGGRVHVTNNHFHHCSRVGVEINPDAVDLHDVMIDGNSITSRTLEGGGDTSYRPIHLQFNAAAVIRDFVVQNNIIDQNFTVNRAIFGTGTALTAESLVVQGNVIRSTSSAEGTEIAIYFTGVAGVTVRDNTIHGTGLAVRLEGADCSVIGNKLYNTAYPTANSAIDLRGARAFVSGNVLRKVFRGIRVETGGTDAVAVNNVIDVGTGGIGRGVTIGGTGTYRMAHNNAELAENPVTVPTIASAATITLLPSGEVFGITGTTGISAITSSWGTRKVTLVFTASLTVTHTGGGASGTIQLAGAANFAATVNDTLTLVSDGTCWREVSRTVI